MSLSASVEYTWTVPEDECNNNENDIVHCDDKYMYDYHWYHEKFPKEWARSHKEDTGPSQCMNCLDYGCVNDVFIGYCANCAIEVYNGERGRGFISQGIEIDDDDEDAEGYKSVFDTYLKGIDIHNIQPCVFENLRSSNVNYIQYNESDYLDADPYEETGNVRTSQNGIMNCDYVGGYNDF